MQTPLPSNKSLTDFSDAIPWQYVEDKKRKFNQVVRELKDQLKDDSLPLDVISEKIGASVTTYYPNPEGDKGNIYVVEKNGKQFILGSAVSKRYRSGKTLAKSIVGYNLNPSVNHTNLHETDSPSTKMRALGAELELGLLKPDGSKPTEAEMQQYIQSYQNNARRAGITPQIDREACQFQVEAHIAPGIGYHQTRHALDGIMRSLIASSESTGLITAILAAFPIESDFDLTDDPKVHTAVDLMKSINGQFPEYKKLQDEVKSRYQIAPESNVVQIFRLQGCHIHLDLAGRSEGLGLLAFYSMLRSATAIANGALLKGSPFVNGTCDDEYLCTREYLRRTTVTGRPLEIPLSPHLLQNDMEAYGELLLEEKVNAVARGLLCESGLGQRISVMHNPIGRLRPDLGSTKRICTLESTGMPVNISASRQAAVLADFEFSHAIIENYFRQYGSDLEPMYEDKEFWEILGPLDSDVFSELQDQSDRHCTDITLKTALGTEMSMAEFYEKKRRFVHKKLYELPNILPRDIDDVYISIERMLTPPSGQLAETVEQYIADPKLRSTGNWGQILRNTFIDEGGTPGAHNPDAVLKVVQRMHNALRERYVVG